MQHSWLVKYDTRTFHKISFFFLLILRLNYYSFISHFNFILLNKIFIKKVNLTTSINFKFKYVENKKELLQFDSSSSFINRNISIITKKKINKKIINLFFFFNESLFSKNLNKTSFFNFFYLKENNSNNFLIDSKKFLLRWQNSFDLLINMFFYKNNPLIFSNPLFKNETLSLNWNFHNWEVSLWKYYFNFFTFKLNKNTKKMNFFFSKIDEMCVDFFLITDVHYHFRNLYLFRELKLFTIGLTPFSVDPWVVSYPIPIFYNNFLVQLFFFKILIFIKKNICFSKYLFFKSIYKSAMIGVNFK